jgi:8-oxo-dGTP pyrophosphatase MutT (NUDIX family)
VALGGIMEHMSKAQIKPTGVLVIISWKNRFFLIKRNRLSNRRPYFKNPDTWAPVTGGMEEEDNGNIEERARKELKEEINIIPKDLKTLGISEKGVGFCFARIDDQERGNITLQKEGQNSATFTLKELSTLKLGGTFPIYLEKYLPIFKKIAEENYTPTAEDFGLEKIQDHADELKTSMKIH